MQIDNNLLQLGAKLELSRREFFFYCNLKAPDFYKPERTYLVGLCHEFQAFLENWDEKVMIVNLPP